MNESIYQLGASRVSIVGSHPILEGLRDELAPVAVVGPARDLTIELVERLEPLKGEVRSLGHVDASVDEVRFHLPAAGITMALHQSEQGRVRVELGKFTAKLGLPPTVFRLANPTFLSTVETQVYLFLIGVIEPLVMASDSATAFVHAAAVSGNDSGVLLTSAGGVGKTTTAMELLKLDGWSFLSDDIALLDADAQRIRLHPRKAMVYEYNVRNDAEQRRRVAGASWASSLHWRAHSRLGTGQPRRRVAAAQLHGAGSVASDAPLDHVFFLVRGASHHDFAVEPLEAAALLERSRAILETEFRNHLDLIRLWEATGLAWTGREKLLDEQTDRLAKALTNASVHQLTIPTGADPKRTAAIVAELTGA